MLNVDLEPLIWCRSAHCRVVELHEAHDGASPRALKVLKPKAVDTAEKIVKYPGAIVREAIIDMALNSVGTYVPTSMQDIWRSVVNDYGDVNIRTVRRAVAYLVDNRLVAALSGSTVCRGKSYYSGWYIRYDSPKLWQPHGLRDLIEFIDDHFELYPSYAARSSTATIQAAL